MALNDGATRKTLPSVASRQQKRIRRCSFDCSSGRGNLPSLFFPPSDPTARCQTIFDRERVRLVSSFVTLAFSAAPGNAVFPPPRNRTGTRRRLYKRAGFGNLVLETDPPRRSRIGTGPHLRDIRYLSPSYRARDPFHPINYEKSRLIDARWTVSARVLLM